MLQNSLFDHKAVGLVLQTKRTYTGPKTFRIKNDLLDTDNLLFRVELSILETYIVHCEDAALPQEARERLLEDIGNLRLRVLNLPYPYKFWPSTDFADPDILARAVSVERIKADIARLNFNKISSLPVSIDGLLFTETLLNNVRNEIISFQSHFLKWKKIKLKQLRTGYLILKKITILTMS
jgi:hypothetical protein